MDNKEKKFTKPTIYDVKVEAERIKVQLEKLSQEAPGVVSKGGKKEVVFAVKTEIEDMIKRGYTVQQIAEAISCDTFKILPKTINEIVNKSKKLKKVNQKPQIKAIVKEAKTEAATITKIAEDPKATESSTDNTSNTANVHKLRKNPLAI